MRDWLLQRLGVRTYILSRFPFLEGTQQYINYQELLTLRRLGVPLGGFVMRIKRGNSEPWTVQATKFHKWWGQGFRPTEYIYPTWGE